MNKGKISHSITLPKQIFSHGIMDEGGQIAAQKKEKEQRRGPKRRDEKKQSGEYVIVLDS